MTIKIGIIGAGNIGTAMATLIAQSSAQVHVAARGARLSDIVENGTSLNDRGIQFSARPIALTTITEPMDAIFVCVKSQSLASALLVNAAAITPDTLVIPMINGMPFWFNATKDGIGSVPFLDPKGELANLLDPRQILGAVLLMTVRMDETGCAISSNTPTLSIGPIVNGSDTDRIETLLQVLETGGLRADLCADIRQKVLVKLLANVATNPLTALTGAMLNDVGTKPALREVALKLADEFRDWARHAGYDLPSNDWLVDLFVDAGDFPTSMLQDAIAGRTLELDAICKAPLEMARRAGGDMPFLSHLITEIETAATLPARPDQIPNALSRLFTLSEFSEG